ncbi:TPA: endonuclease/exonuclease/phosphatase family protein, partial [Klebsiella pneumoniae]|nr:endonuclease/exonuclease/phosphatase family protein [Klebsiella pneumoniae]HAJ2981915.1 endonuclease/exonuclease/phosphatase family protein [Escherichia coli]HBX1605244.1 endonuclease/exonuclease/phosphatase family protein [Klebsiella pneumoniae subsp. pneumoniae]HAJ3266836.1 endonuclease/exonuclease/phosphatase family protein [Escherichia coli]HBX2014379.1 endonuclease/exonuclease/phosphatase family protein [Klebsiella pneumoniae]
MELNLCWWNIGISPPVKGVKKDKAEAIRLAKHY